MFEAGAGPVTVMLVPGIPDLSAVYRGQVRPTRRRITGIAPDLLGTEDSDIPDGIENHPIAQDQERLWAVADALGAVTSTS